MKLNKQVFIILSVVFIDLLGFGIIIPIFPLLIQRHGGNALTVGIIIALYSLFQFLFSPILGRLSDKFGRKPVLVISAFINALSYLLLFFSRDLIFLFLARSLGGIGGSNISVGQAYIADVSKSHERTKLMALFGAMFGLGMMIGPFIGGVLTSYFNESAPFLVTFLIAFFNSLLIFLFVTESNKNLQKHIKIELFNLKIAREVVKPENMKFLFLLFFFVNMAFALTFGIFPLFSEQVFSWGEAENGYFFGMIGLVSFLTQAFLIRLLLKKFNERILIIIGLLVTSISYFTLGLSTTIIFLMISAIINAFGFGIVNPNIQSLVSLASKENEQGIVLGILQSFGSLARIIGPIVGGLVAVYKINLPYVISSISLFLILIWGFKYLKLSTTKIIKEIKA